jgi:hypothetical protein
MPLVDLCTVEGCTNLTMGELCIEHDRPRTDDLLTAVSPSSALSPRLIENNGDHASPAPIAT